MLSRTGTRAARSIPTLLRPSLSGPPRRSLHRPAAAAVIAVTRPQPRPCAARVATAAWRSSGGSVLRGFASGRSPADEIIEDITEQYSTTKDEFEIAVEETEKNTLYAAEDRAAAAEEMEKLKQMYEAALAENPEAIAADIKRRIGGRIRELDEAIKGLEESSHQES